jgi:hypothetical protein
MLLITVPYQPILGQSNPVRGAAGDLWADKVIGHADFGEHMPNAITGNRLFNPGGVIVDRSVRPNRVYVIDSNSRVLGFDHLGAVTSGAAGDIGKPCTSNSDYPGATCTIQEGRIPDLVIGQPSFDRGACNGDGNFQHYPDWTPASASTLCTMPAFQVSTTEGGSFANMFVDNEGNLYVPDWDNHRVLRYDSPFETDTVADAVWGQADFSGNRCNRGRGYGRPDAESLCFESPYNVGFVGGAAVDAGGNLWVSDNANNRVLRFPFDPALNRPGTTANLVLGQPDFFSYAMGLGMNQMRAPAGVRVTNAGRVYVADSQQTNNGNGRVLYFDPPYSNGKAATGRLNYDFRAPTDLEFDVSGGLWVNDRENYQLLLFSNPNTIAKVLFKDVPNATGECGGNYQGDGAPMFLDGNPGVPFDLSNVCGAGGSVGVDSDGNILVSSGDFVQGVLRFPAPIPTPHVGIAHSPDAFLFKPYQFGEHNATTMSSLYAPRGIAVTADQLIISDGSRLLFWNDPLSMGNGEAADGYVGTSDPLLFFNPPTFGRIRQDQSGHLWVLRGEEIQVYNLPLTTGATPFLVLPSSQAILGGGTISWDDSLVVGGVAPAGDARWLWVADPRHHRVFRIHDPLNAPLVDIILGQTSASGISCNQGQSQPTQTSLCHPGGVALDPAGILYVADHALEIEGNHRLLEFDAALFPENPSALLLGIPATRVIGTNGSFTGPCQTLCGPFEPTFSSTGMMVVGYNGYSGSRFPLLFPTPLQNENHIPLQDYGSMPYAAVFGDQDNLYIVDKNRGRALFYQSPLPESTPPVVDLANAFPADNAIGVPVNANIAIPFNEAVTASASAFTLTCGATQAVTVTGSHTLMLTVNPTANLPASTACTLTGTAAGITDPVGNPLVSDFTLHFTTGTTADTSLPTVSLTTPSANVGVRLDIDVVLTFSEPVNIPAGFTGMACPHDLTTIYTTTPPLPATNVLTLTLDPVYDLPFGVTCEVSMVSTELTDIAGNPVVNPGVFTFDTVAYSTTTQAPLRNVFTTDTPTLTWAGLSWAVSYEVEVDTDAAFTLPRPTGYTSPLPAATTRLTLLAALPEGTYYFRVRGKSAAGAVGPYSTPERFTIISG